MGISVKFRNFTILICMPASAGRWELIWNRYSQIPICDAHLAESIFQTRSRTGRLKMKNRTKTKTAVKMAMILLAAMIFHYFGAVRQWDIGISDGLNQKVSATNKKIYIK